MEDFYKLLGIERDASQEEIKSAYRKMAKESHPDHGGDKKLFELIQIAYSILSDTIKKRDYDEKLNKSNEILKSLFSQAIDSVLEDQIEFGYVLDRVKMFLNSKIEKYSMDRYLFQDNIKKLDEISGRIKTKKRYNIFEELIKGKIKFIEDELETLEKDLSDHEDALTLLRGYKYSFVEDIPFSLQLTSGFMCA